MTYDLNELRRAEFPWTTKRETLFLNNASTGPLPERTVRALEEWARLRANPARISQEFQFDTIARTRELIAKLIHADEDEIALATNTTFGLNLAAFSLPLEKDDIVLSPEGEFPANVYPWMALADRRGVEYRTLKCNQGVLTAEQLRHELDANDRIRVVTVSWVQAITGARVDLAALGELCRERGVFFVVDAIQGLGALTLDLSRIHIDILTCGGQKWLLGPWGSGFVYIRRGLIEHLEPHDVSWMAFEGTDDFSTMRDFELTWRENARKFEFITLPYQDLAAFNASLELIHELGPDAISRHTLGLADQIVRWAVERDDVQVTTPIDASHRAAIILVCPRDIDAAHERLLAGRVAHSVRQGGVRLSPHFYNTAEDVSEALAILGGSASSPVG